jgi:GNAT superfamily N-acetyltransferase
MRTMVTVRPLAVGDASACDQIVAGLTYHFANDEGRRMCAEDVRTQDGLVAIDRDRVVGFVTFVPQFEETAEITWMAVEAERRSEGIGRILMESLVDHLRVAGKRLLILLTVSPHGDEGSPPEGYPATRAFYSAMGFTLARNLPREWTEDLAVLMVRPL